MRQITTTVNYCNINLVIEYEVHGGYYPATLEQPEEQPDFYINSIFLEDSTVDILSLFLDTQLDSIYDLISDTNDWC